MFDKTAAAALLGAIFFYLMIIIFWPIFVIWAWNVLFGAALTIPTNFFTWLAVIVLSMTLNARSNISQSKK